MSISKVDEILQSIYNEDPFIEDTISILAKYNKRSRTVIEAIITSSYLIGKQHQVESDYENR